jgi:hypothetical protein
MGRTGDEGQLARLDDPKPQRTHVSVDTPLRDGYPGLETQSPGGLFSQAPEHDAQVE